ncbi:MAG: tripartite tricarboxylate transporter TctB family protein [Candidatus Rokuibacteriota bacterium]
MTARLPGLAVIAVGVTAVVLARRIPVQAGFGLGPAFLPFWTGVALVGCGLWIALRPSPAEAPARSLGRAALGLGLLVLYAAALEPLGFVPATAAFLLGGNLLLDAARPGRAALVGLGGVLFLRLVFRGWLGVPLPGGPLDW